MQRANQLSDFYLQLPDHGLTPNDSRIVTTRPMFSVEVNAALKWMNDYPGPGVWCHQWTSRLSGDRQIYDITLFMSDPNMAFEAKLRFG